MAKPATDDQILRRVCAEYLEMPGLRLTERQARRLFGLSEDVCRSVLGALVEEDFLVRRTDGIYCRPTADVGRRRRAEYVERSA